MSFVSLDRRAGRAAKLLAAAAVAAALGVLPAAADTNPFSTLVGTWTGKGMVTYSSGTKERLQCRVTYDSNADDSVQQHLTCASTATSSRSRPTTAITTVSSPDTGTS